MKLSELIYPNEYDSLIPPDDIEIPSVEYRFNHVQDGCLFICLRGTHLDTHTMLGTLKAKPAVIIAEKVYRNKISSDVPILYVESSRRALSYIWNRFCGAPTEGLIFTGITGTNGKTSTAHILDHICRENHVNTALIGTTGCYIKGERQSFSDESTMTTPDPEVLYPFLLQAKKCGVTHVIMEVSSHALYYEKVAPITFDIGIFTNLSPEHLDFHATMEEYADTKKKLFRMCKQAIVNYDDPLGAAIAATSETACTTCGILWDADANASQIDHIGNNTYSYFYKYNDIRQLVKLQIQGNYQVYNSLLAQTAAYHLGIPMGRAVHALSHLRCIPGRLEEISTREDDVRVLIDFAHTEAALQSLLTELRLTTQNNLILLFGCGGDRDTSKRPLMGACAMQYADHTIITSDNSRSEDTVSIIKDILRGHTDKTKRTIISDRARAIRHAILQAERGDTIVLAGKGHEKYEIRQDGKHSFDEAGIAREALRHRRDNYNKV